MTSNWRVTLLGLMLSGSCFAEANVPAFTYQALKPNGEVQEMAAVNVPESQELAVLRELLEHPATTEPVFVIDSEGDQVAQAIDQMPESQKANLAEIRVQAPAGYKLDQVKKAGLWVSGATTLASVAIYISAQVATSSHPWISSLAGTSISFLLTAFFNGWFHEDTPARFSAYLNGGGDLLVNQLKKYRPKSGEKTQRIFSEIGKGLAVAPASVGITCLYLLAIHYDNLFQTFATGQGWVTIFSTAAAGYFSNLSWDLFEARARKVGAGSEQSEIVARSSMAGRQIFGSLLGPLLNVPGLQVPAQAVFAAHGFVGLAALANDRRAMSFTMKILNHMSNSKIVSKTIATIVNVKKKISGAFRVVSRLMPWARTKIESCVEKLTPES